MLNALDWIYIKITTYLKVNKCVYFFGSIIYPMGAGLLSAGLFEWISYGNIFTGILLIGTMMMIMGIYVKEKANKKGF